ncbi:MAG: hypothetical protein ACE5IR_11315 [bacterium]
MISEFHVFATFPAPAFVPNSKNEFIPAEPQQRDRIKLSLDKNEHSGFSALRIKTQGGEVAAERVQ